MTISDVRKLSEKNYEYIKTLDIIAGELIRDGEIISNVKIGKSEAVLVIKNDNILYKLHMYGGDTCKSITWERT